jgi:hypothetical protein
VIDSTVIRQARYGAVSLGTAGSRLSRSMVDTTTTGFAPAGFAVVLGASTKLEATTVRGSAAQGIDITGANVAIDGIRVTGSGSYPLRSAIQQLVVLESAEQDSLVGNAVDLVVVTGGTLASGTVTIGAALRWYGETGLTVDAGGLLVAEPGARVVMVGTGNEPNVGSTLTFQNGGRLEARGTVGSPVVFTVADTVNTVWGGLAFTGSPADSSYLVNARVQYAGNTYWQYHAVRTSGSHPLVIDSTVFRQARYGAVSLGTAGSRLSRSVVDTTTTGFAPAGPAVVLGVSSSLDGSRVRSSGARGVAITGANVILGSCEVTAGASDGVYVTAGTSVTINNCNLVDNAGLGVNNVSGTLIDATNNWWGDAAGPTGPSGDGVSANVTYIPFLTEPVTILGPFSAPPAPVAPSGASRGGK